MYEVIVYFDNMVDDVKVFETKESAKAEVDNLGGNIVIVVSIVWK